MWRFQGRTVIGLIGTRFYPFNTNPETRAVKTSLCYIRTVGLGAMVCTGTHLRLCAEFNDIEDSAVDTPHAVFLF